MKHAVAVGLVTLTVAACVPPHTPAPPVHVTNAAEPDQRHAVLAYASSLTYDTLTHGSYDRQALTVVDSSVVPPRDTVGAVGTIYPEVNTHHNSEADLSGKGRIVARIYSTAPYPRIGLAAGWSYFWVDSLQADSGTGRMLLIPADSTQPVTVRALKYTRDPVGASHDRQAMARWKYFPLHSALPWERCTKMGCCEAL